MKVPAIDPAFHPRWWMYWGVVGFLRITVWFPRGSLRWLGYRLGDAFFWLSRRRRRIARVNVALCFPASPPAAQEHLVREHFRAVGYALFEIALAWWASDAHFQQRVHIEGLENLDRALEKGRGVLLLSAHFTTMEVLGRLLVDERPMAAMYRPHENPVVEALFARQRQRHGVLAIRRDDVKGMLRALRDNRIVWYAPDQSKAGKQSVLAPFFGQPAATQTSTHRIARASGAPVVPFFGWRTANGHYRLCISPALTDFPSDDPLQDTTRINQLIEQAVRQAPEQYFWTHRRFKGHGERPCPYDPAEGSTLPRHTDG